MVCQSKPKVANLEQQEEELTPEQAEAEQGGAVITGSIEPLSHAILSPRDPASGLPTGK